MAGHSKWSNIKRKKAKTDAQRAKVFTKISREISVCVREGGPDPEMNSKLRDVIEKAKSLNVPNDNIDRVIKRAQGGDRDDYKGVMYEGYGPSGIAVLVSALTDNRNRTAANIRHYFDKFGGNLGQTGSVSFMFTKTGVITIEEKDLDEEQLMEDVVDIGADDFEIEEGICEVLTQPESVSKMGDALRDKGYNVVSAEVDYLADTYTVVEGQDNLDMLSKLLSHLDDDDDVQDVWHTLENAEDLEI